MIEAQKSGDKFAVMKILREQSPFLRKESLQDIQNQSTVLHNVSMRISDIASLWDAVNEPTCIDIYRKLDETKLFELPVRIDAVLSDADSNSEKVIALKNAFSAPFSEILHYWEYITDKSPFTTHQGIKGLEFERVAVIMDDENAGGSLFSYEKLFGARALSETDRRNISEGKDSAISRTTRLFYVTCTRAKDSLALIAYTSNQEAVRKTAIENVWFSEDEVVFV